MSSASTPARRKPPEQRRAEILRAASRIAVDEGLDRLTAKSVAEALGVYPGLINHYFASADVLVAASFAYAATEEREELFGAAEAAGTPLAQIRALLHAWLDPARDPVSLLWLDAWQASRRRPALSRAVTDQMTVDLQRLSAMIDRGRGSGDFQFADAETAATRILALIDGLSVRAAIRASIDYSTVADMVLESAARTLGLDPGVLRNVPDR